MPVPSMVMERDGEKESKRENKKKRERERESEQRKERDSDEGGRPLAARLDRCVLTASLSLIRRLPRRTQK